MVGTLNKMKFTYAIFGLIIGIVLGYLFFGMGGDADTSMMDSDEEIVFGYVGPLSGEAAIYGVEEKNALSLALDEINKEGGIDGQQVRIIFEDGKCSGKDALSAAQKLINVENVKVILGGACSGETLAMAPLTEESKVLLFSSLSTSPDVTNAGDFVFRNAPSDIISGKTTADLAYRNGVRKMGILSENTDYAQGFRKVFMASFDELGGETVGDEIYAPGTSDFRTIVTKVLATNPDAVFVDPQAANGALVAKQLREAGYDGPLYGNVVISANEVINEYGEYLEGMYFSDASGLDTSNPPAAAFMEKYENAYDIEPSFTYYAGARYDSLYMFKEAIEAVGFDTEEIRDYLYEEDFEGVIGTYGFDSNGDIADVKFDDKQIVNGEVTVL